MVQKLQSVEPFRALPKVELRHEHPHGSAVNGFQTLAIEFVRNEAIVAQHRGQGKIRGVRVIGVLDDVRHFGFGLGALDQIAKPDTAPLRVFLGPARNAMDVAAPFRRRQGAQLVEIQFERPLDEPRETQPPRRFIELRHIADVQHRKARCYALSGRHRSVFLLEERHERFDARRDAQGCAAKSERVAIPFPKRKVTRAVAHAELALLEATYPAAVTALDYGNPFELLIAVILSAQCTDARVNLTTPFLFARYPDPAALAAAPLDDVEAIVKSCGFFRMKAKNIISASRALLEAHGGSVPRDRAALEALPGVGRKTAAVVMSVAFEDAAFAVDTHVFRVAHRLGLTLGKTPRAVEDDVTKLVPAAKWRHAHHWLILHGRAVCKAPLPRCEDCPIAMCPSRSIVLKAKSASARARRGAAAAAVRRPAR